MTTPDPMNVPLILEALRSYAAQQTRAAGRLSEQVMADKRAGSRDVRSSAVRVVDVLAAGQYLTRFADALESGDVVLLEAPFATPPPLTEYEARLEADPGVPDPGPEGEQPENPEDPEDGPISLADVDRALGLDPGAEDV